MRGRVRDHGRFLGHDRKGPHPMFGERGVAEEHGHTERDDFHSHTHVLFLEEMNAGIVGRAG
jgi:hypothetical protein